ncbi:sce7726 family protein [Cupriavidus cauae]|uniref:sce7726 family protein n=1 Tax=Cupriavidus cauae TaxID=2608999 RepID=UPI001CC1E2D3|nr:sce7726 family protein [Cupriavidus cauae]UZN51663.1 sce7726 family protein [Cupriavidus cauae]
MTANSVSPHPRETVRATALIAPRPASVTPPPLVLRDREIREALRLHLARRIPAPARVIEELGVHNGNAKADLVAIYREMHCFEIKGATDSIRRLIRQASYFDQTFPKVTLVTTENHLTWCLRYLPVYWGIMVATRKQQGIALRYVRAALSSPRFAKQKALMMLWKAELTSIATDTAKIPVKRAYTREDLAIHLSRALDKRLTLASIQDAIRSRSGEEYITEVGDMTGER